MLSFLRGDADVLVATTIIESGLDVPAANTLVVERADHLGLAQAYQIRGRVGRSRERAYAYMLYPSEEGVTREAAARLATLADHTELGSGFRIAMRDLELRGAGDLLGAEQSGPRRRDRLRALRRDARQAVAELRAEREGDGEERAEAEVRVDTDVSAFVPSAYVPYEAAKIDVHRRIAAARAPGRAARAARRAARPLRPAARAGRGAARRAAGADRARPARARARCRCGAARILAEPLELESDRVGRIRERDPGGDLLVPRGQPDAARRRPTSPRRSG